MAKPNGVIIYRGVSMLDGRKIVAVMTGTKSRSENAKTGDFLQTWIMTDNGLTPDENIRRGRDSSVCGDCPHRSGSCYVNAGQAPHAVYKGVGRGIYPKYNPAKDAHLLQGRNLRIGSYGDPVAVPFEVWEGLLPLVANRTGYTHQWRNCDTRFKTVCMASCETPSDVALAQQNGWRTFRVRLADTPTLPSEVVCPASAEAGKRRTCETCKACRGSAGGKSIVIIAHGLDYKVSRYAAVLGRLALPVF